MTDKFVRFIDLYLLKEPDSFFKVIDLLKI